MTVGSRTIQHTDNRDLTTTVIILDNGDQVEVDPCDLFMNALANAGMTQTQFDQATQYLSTSIAEMASIDLDENDPTGNTNHANRIHGLEWILQTLMTPGYKFT